jgi:hypothetical protein
LILLLEEKILNKPQFSSFFLLQLKKTLIVELTTKALSKKSYARGSVGVGGSEGKMHSLFGVIIVLGFEGGLPGFRRHPVFEGSAELSTRLGGASLARKPLLSQRGRMGAAKP